MRVSDKTTSRNFLNYLNNAKTNFAKTNERVASGKRFKRISEDVSAGTRVLRVRGDLKKTEEYLDNVKSINEELSVTENALSYVNEKLVQAHTRIVKGLNDPSGASGRGAIANEISAIKKEILQYANTRYNNKFVLGGSASASAPFTIGADGKLLYNGIDVDEIKQNNDGSFYYGTPPNPIPMDGELYADIGLGLKMTGSNVQTDTAFKASYSGLEILGFGKDNDGTTKNLYNLLSDIESSLRSGNMESLGKLDAILVDSTDRFGKFVTDIGTKTNFLDSIETRAKSSIDSYKKQINNLMGIDDAEEAANQTLNDYVLKAVLRMGSDILPLSLMDFLN